MKSIQCKTIAGSQSKQRQNGYNYHYTIHMITGSRTCYPPISFGKQV